MGTAAMIIVPDTTSLLAHRLGIGRGVELIVYLRLRIRFSRMFRLYGALARLEQTITALVSTMAVAQRPEAVDSTSAAGRMCSRDASGRDRAWPSGWLSIPGRAPMWGAIRRGCRSPMGTSTRC
jgi:Uncharacterized conserved protein (DUF2304)